MKEKLRALIAIAVILLTISCGKKQDLISKAFEDKNFDKPLEKIEQDPKGLKDKDEEDQDTKIEVLVDRIAEDPDDQAHFIETGDTKRPRPDLLARKDPEAPIINMEEAKLYDIIKLLCDLMEVNYLIDPSVKDQTITISMTRSDQKLKTSDLLDLLLKLHDLTMVENGSFISIVPIESSEIYPGLNLLYGSRPNESLRREELIMQIVPLRYVSAADLSGVIRDFLSPSARVLEEQRNNVLIIIDKNHYIRKVLELIPIFDVDVLANKKMVFYELAHVDAVETGSKLEEILGVYGYESGSESLAIVPIETLNGLLVVSNSENIFKELDFWIEKFDQEAQFEEEQVFVYKVENTTADAISFTLSQLFGLRTSGGGGSRVNQGASSRRSTNPNSQFGSNRGGGLNNRNLNRNNPNDPSNRNNLNRNNPNDPNNRNLNRNNPSNRNLNNRNLNRTGANNLQGDGPLMIVDDDNNSLIFKTTHREYTRIFKTLKELDVLPRQVFLEVTVLSVRLTDTFALGLTWNATDTPGDSAPGGTSPISSVAGGFEGSDGGAPSFAGAYSYASSTALITASLSAAKSKGYVNVLQQPHIMAIDNQTASISVGTAIPIQTTRTNIGDIGDGTALNPASSSTIQYRDTGVSLAFTPHINANGVIRLEIDLDISSADDQSTSAEAVPISQNTLSTEMIVRDNQTVVMGGLIFDQEGWGRDSVPFLGRIPVLKHLFTNRNSSVTKSELIVMITPKLVDSEEKSLAISREFKDKILKEFDSFKGPGN